jgi:hypothetical protein
MNMSTEDHVRIEIGFDGTQIMSALVTPETADELESALRSRNDGSVVLDAEDGRYTVPLARVVYLKRFAREGRLRFGNV